DRILTQLGNRAGGVSVRTFHGFCTQVLRHEAEALGIPADFTICDEEDAREILVDLARRQGVAPDAASQLGEVLLKLVERMKRSLIGSSEGHDATALPWALAEQSRDLAFFGDIDQTIYEWRGPDPFRTLAEFKRRFDPVREITLTKNYRSSRDILQACEAFIRAHPNAVTQALVSESEDAGRRL